MCMKKNVVRMNSSRDCYITCVYAHTLAHMHTHALYPTFAHMHTHALYPTLAHMHTHALYPTFAHMHTHGRTQALAFSRKIRNSRRLRSAETESCRVCLWATG